jgi:hypothetical protein
LSKAAKLLIIKTYILWFSVVISVTLWLRSSLFASRRKKVMANALDTIAECDRIWSEQYLADRQRNRTAYDLAVNSPAMNVLRNETARRKAIEDVAREFGLMFADAERVYPQAEVERDARALKPISS